MNGLAYVLITQDMVDRDFLDHYCQGYDQSTLPQGIPPNNSYKDYILGSGPDGLAKTPQWAATISGIPAERIIQLAHEIGNAKPAYITQGWGPQRHAGGEQSARAISMLAILTGNVGVPGGNTGDREGPYGIPWPEISIGRNPVEAAIPCFLWTKAIENPTRVTDLTDGLRGKKRLDSPIKFIWCFASNMLINQHADINRTRSILKDDSLCEMIVLIDNVMTSSARYADILLPGTSSFEERDLAYQGYAVEMGVLILREKAIAPLGRSRTLFDFCRDELTKGGQPACVAACPTRAIEFGDYDKLAAVHTTDVAIAPLPPLEMTSPDLLIRPPKLAKPTGSTHGLILNPEEVKDE